MNYRALVISLGVVCAVAILSGCEVDNSDLVQHSYTTEQHDEETGLRLKPSVEMWVSFPEMVNIYVSTEACMGMTAPGPTVYFKSFLDWFKGGIGAVWGFHIQGTIYVNLDENIPMGFERNKYTDTETLRHEYIHNILFHITGDGDPRHMSPMYTQCGMGPAVNN